MSERQPSWDPDGHQPQEPALAADLEDELRYGRAPRRRRWLARFLWELQACRGLDYSPRLPSNQQGKGQHVVRHLLARIEAGVIATAVLGPIAIGGSAAFFPHAEDSATGGATTRSSPAADAALSAHAVIGSNTPVPAAPSNLTAKAVGTTSIQLTWTNNAGNQSGVVISLDGEQSVDLQGATVSSYTWNGLSPNTKYWFYVASKIYGTPGDPTGYGNTQSAWVGPVYATTAGAQPSTAPAPQPSTSPAPQLSTSPSPQPSTSPTPQPSTTGPGVPTTLPTQPSPTFVCVTGPGGSCLQPGAGVSPPSTWAPTPPTG